MDKKVTLTLSYREFYSFCEQLLEKSQRLGDNWELRKTHSRSAQEAQHYLVKKSTLKNRRQETTEEKDLLDLAGDTSGLSEESDVATVHKQDKHEDTCVQMEYHVIHSVAFQVPILYFTATCSNGQTLALADIWELLSTEFISPGMDRWGLVTQQEHPYLGRPFYHIHPCHTAGVMGGAMQCCSSVKEDESERTGKGNYLVTWLSTFGPVVGLKLSLEYAQ